jgi:glycolate oxidase FAD binding subunit
MLGGFEIEGARPGCAVRPDDEGGVAAVLFEAQRHGLAVIACGSGKHRSIGNVPRDYDVALDTTALRATFEHEPNDLTVTVDAGVRFGDFADALAMRGQWLPVDAPADATVGGVLAANVSGPLRHAYGTLRDWVIGMRVAHPNGSISKSGGRVVKNVAGYDMHKLHIGALGTLGVITQVTFKLATIPQRSVSLVATFADPGGACEFVLGVRDQRLSCISAEVRAEPSRSGDAAEWRATVRLAGTPAGVDRSLLDLAALAKQHGTTAIDDGGDATTPNVSATTSLALRASAMPSNVAALLERVVRLNAGLVDLSATVCAGVVRCSVAEFADGRALIEQAQRDADALDGSLFVESAPLDVKRRIDVFGRDRPDWMIMRQLKREFDPAGTLSPGRYVGRI